MPSTRRGSLLVSFALLPLGACASGVEEPGGPGFTGPVGGPADDPFGGSGSEDESGDDDGGDPPGSTAGGSGSPNDGDETGDDGNPLCCEVHPTAGCGSVMTEACVCTIMPSCCQSVWTQDCVDQAAACGDPFCDAAPPDDSGDPPPDDSGGDPPPDDSGGDPPPPDPPPTNTCPCSGDPTFDNFCFYPPGTADCPMTQPMGYCDPNGDGSYDDGDWVRGYNEYAAQC
ncbi:MAG: hypothetical protein H6712_16715 [Myxococcales bacterium]|nr:hypothetical protein [Myxococcales bacterium]MCB9715514.1 hypothetical protein [Myxococcales bacterium]